MMGPHARNIDEERQLPTLDEVINDPLTRQEGGDHYKSMGIQPVEFLKANLSHREYTAFLKGNIQKYVFREKGKNLEDYRKARHYIDMLIQAEEEVQRESPVSTS